MIEVILDTCLEDIELRGASIADCLAKYPEYAKELKPLLEVAMSIRSVPDIQPSPEFKQALRDRLLHLPEPPDHAAPAGDGKSDEAGSSSDGAVHRDSKFQASRTSAPLVAEKQQ